MPYAIERGVRSYRDHDTPAEYASDADEEQAAFNDARDAAFTASEELHGLVDDLYEAHGIPAADMAALRDKIVALVGEAKRLLGE